MNRQLTNYKEIFESIDLDHHGRIERIFLIERLSEKDISVVFANKVFDRMDSFHRGSLSFYEFCLFMDECHEEHSSLFNRIDVEKSGKITYKQFEAALHCLHLVSDESITAVITDKDAEMDIHVFDI